MSAGGQACPVRHNMTQRPVTTWTPPSFFRSPFIRAYQRSVFARLVMLLSQPFLVLTVKGRCRRDNYGLLRFGKSRFRGSPEFLALSSCAMDGLALLDPVLHRSVLAERLEFWYEPTCTLSFHGFQGISDGYLVWREQGVIAWIIFLHFKTHLNSEEPWWRAWLEGPFARREKAKDAVHSWLSEHGFPEDLTRRFAREGE